jgi:prepilin signal peptidase PulO-like enzyme (type II secretory pathway)
MTIVTLFFAFIFGATLGSFALVVADRYRVKNFWGGRSQCMSCAKELTWKENIPIISYLVQRGKCKGCKSKYSSTYLWVELFAGLSVSALVLTLQNLTANTNYQLGLLMFFSVLIVLSVIVIIYDLRHTVVPLEVVTIMLGMGIVATIFRQYINGFNIFDFMSGVIVALPFAFLHLVSRGRWVGAGDILVYAAFGFIFGLPIATSGFFYSVWIGAFVSLAFLFLHKKDYNLKSEIPFAPFIILGMFLAFFTLADILGLHEILYL